MKTIKIQKEAEAVVDPRIRQRLMDANPEIKSLLSNPNYREVILQTLTAVETMGLPNVKMLLKVLNQQQARTNEVQAPNAPDAPVAPVV